MNDMDSTGSSRTGSMLPSTRPNGAAASETGPIVRRGRLGRAGSRLATSTSVTGFVPAVLVAAALFTSGCAGGSGPARDEATEVTPPTTTATSASGVSQDDRGLIPPGYGTLRQDDVTLTLRRDDLLIKVTPLDPAVIRVLATDTWERLRGLREGHGPELVHRTGISDPDLFLVSFFSYEQQVPFEPEDVHLLNRGLRFRPRGIRAITPGWGRQRLAQEGTQMAVYAFDSGIDLEQDLMAEYQDQRASGWERVLQEIQAERARILARARSM